MLRILIVALLFATNADASSVLTFQGGTNYFDDQWNLYYEEDKFHVAPDPMTGSFVEGGHIHYGYASAGNFITWGGGSQFNATSVDLQNSFTGYRWEDTAGNIIMCGTLCLDVEIVGFRNGIAVASAIASSAINGTFSFDDTFSAIDSLYIGIRRFSQDAYYQQMQAAGWGFYYEEDHFNYGNFTIAPVPIPAGMALMLTGLGVLGFFGRRRV